jgi:uncharacterized protein YciI
MRALKLAALFAALVAAAPAAAADWAIELRFRPDLVGAKSYPPADHARLGEHFRQVQALLANGKAAFAGRSMLKDAGGGDDASVFGVVVLTGVERPEAEAIVAADAAVKAGVLTARLHPFFIVPRPAAK